MEKFTLRNFKQLVSNNIYIFLILLLSSTTFFWFKSDFIFNHDSGYNDIANEFRLSFLTWNPFNAPGSLEDRRILFNFGYILEYKILTFLFSYPVAQRIMYYFYLASSWLGVYFLSRVIGFKKKMGFLAGGLYTFNILTLVSIFHYGSGTVSYSYVFIPFIVALFIKGLNEHKGFSYCLIINCIALFGLGVAYVNPVYAITIFAFTFVYLLYSFLILKRDIKILFTRLKYFTFFVLTFGLLNLAWIPNFYLNSKSQLSIAFTTIKEENAREKIVNESYEPTRLFNLLGFWAFFGRLEGRELYLQFSPYYKNPFILFLSYVLPFLVFASYFLSKERKEGILFWYIATVFSIGFIGLARFPEVSEYFLQAMEFNSFISTGYRNVLTKIAPILMMGYSLLFAVAIDSIALRSKSPNLQKAIYLIAFVLFILVLPFPLWRGEQFRIKIDRLSSAHVRIPEYYKKAKAFVAKHKGDYRYIALPIILQAHIDLNWAQGYDGNIPLAQLLVKPVLCRNSGPAYNLLTNSIGPLIEGGKPNDQVPKLMSLYNTRSAIFFRDINWAVGARQRYTFPNKLKTLENFLVGNSQTFQYKKDIGKLSVYNLDIKYYLPHIYTAQKILLSNDTPTELPNIVSSPDYQLRSAIIFQKSKLDLETKKLVDEMPSEIKNLPVIEYRQINPIKYRVKIHNAKDAFPLVFSDTFDVGWKTYLVKSKIIPIQSGQKSKIEDLNDYKILDGNEEDQASKEEVKNYLDQGWITSLGDGKGKKIKHMRYFRDEIERLPIFKWEEEAIDYVENYKIDYISKNFQDTIQNDNLANGSIWETWLPRQITKNKKKITDILQINSNTYQISDKNHLIMNGYANSWIIDPNEVCKVESSKVIKSGESEGFCRKNADGSYEMELVVEHWPQRLYLAGMLVSGITIFICIGYLIYNHFRKSRESIFALKRIEIL